MDVLEVDAWVNAGLIREDQADAIRAYEDTKRARPAAVRRLPLGAELAVYVGSLIALMGGQMVIVRAWDGLGYPGRLAVGLVVALVGFVAGRVLARIHESGTDRLASFMWVIGTGGVAIAVATTLLELDVRPRAWVAVVTGAAVVIVSALLWRNREDRPLQLATSIGGLVVVGIGLAPLTEVATWVAGIVMAAASIVVGSIARAGLLHPRWLVMMASAAGAIIGAAMIAELQEQLGFGLACVVAGAVVAVALAEGENALLGVGVIGFLITLQALLATTFDSAVASPIVVAVGLLIVIMALVRTLRPRRRTT
jgi:hypothetical protein